MVVSNEIGPGALVRWVGGEVDRWGVVLAIADNRRSVTVHFDDGETLNFAWPAENLERVILEKGQSVRLEATGERGNVADVMRAGERVLYVVSLADGSRKTVTEDGVRPAIETDPLVRMQGAELDSARSVNLRIAATRLLFAHQYDELSSLSNSRVEIKPHQVAVLHRVASTFPHRFLLADEVGLGKTIEAGLIIKELRARGFADRVLILAPSGIVSQWQYELKTKFNTEHLALPLRKLGEEALEVVPLLDRLEGVLAALGVPVLQRELDGPAHPELLKRPLDHLVDDDPERHGVALPPGELREQPQHDVARDLVRVVVGQAQPQPVDRDRVVRRQQGGVVPFLEEPAVLGVAGIGHRRGSPLGHVPILRPAA
jgi:hypothetical protein